jgi:hypothetical protein
MIVGHDAYKCTSKSRKRSPKKYRNKCTHKSTNKSTTSLQTSLQQVYKKNSTTDLQTSLRHVYTQVYDRSTHRSWNKLEVHRQCALVMITCAVACILMRDSVKTMNWVVITAFQKRRETSCNVSSRVWRTICVAHELRGREQCKKLKRDVPRAYWAWSRTCKNNIVSVHAVVTFINAINSRWCVFRVSCIFRTIRGKFIFHFLWQARVRPLVEQ